MSSIKYKEDMTPEVWEVYMKEQKELWKIYAEKQQHYFNSVIFNTLDEAIAHGQTSRRIQVSDKYYRWRRNKLVEIPPEWVGKTTHPQTIRKRQSKQ